METKRSPILPRLHAKKTDCVVEWLCGLLNEEDSQELQSFRDYMNNYLAYSEESSDIIDLYYQNSLRSIRKLQKQHEKLDEINALFDRNLKSLSVLFSERKDEKLRLELQSFFSACDAIAAA